MGIVVLSLNLNYFNYYIKICQSIYSVSFDSLMDVGINVEIGLSIAFSLTTHF